MPDVEPDTSWLVYIGCQKDQNVYVFDFRSYLDTCRFGRAVSAKRMRLMLALTFYSTVKVTDVVRTLRAEITKKTSNIPSGEMA